MLKKLDWYTIKTFFGPFLFIFSVLFFIFMVQFAWQEMDTFAGKGLDFPTILKLLFYMGLSVVSFVMPLTVLLSSIMTFGGFGERYELAAMKSTGISLGRIMLPLGVFVILICIGLFYFSDTVVPQSQRKAKNMLLNIARTSPALNFDAGIFIDGVPGFTMKLGDKSGEKGEFIKDVFIHKDASSNENQQTIVAKEGLFVPAEDKRYLKLELYDGYIYEDEVKGKKQKELEHQINRSVKFDSLIQYFNIASIIEKAIEKESVTDYYKFMSTQQLANRIDTLKTEYSANFDNIAKERYNKLIYQSTKLDSLPKDKEYSKPFAFNRIDSVKQVRILQNAVKEIERDSAQYSSQANEMAYETKNYGRHVMQLNRNFSNSLMCLAFFLIGAPLGAIIRKGGVGMPVVVAIIIFILFYMVYMYSENLMKNGVMDPVWATWLPLVIFFPVGLFFTYKAMNDSEIFNLSAYLKPFKQLKNLFVKTPSKEHARYQ